ncbi:hypothetical protein UFOVP1040_11 [uncultured Caudovirales phage]|uniref:Uncharacterized protein n=1 Tax=uncultured Caudovirales phage TaxID=2100421 RepID=A0A6J5Q910_9CAUD|nr:hypothetical protein UFOVP1040_11 [uncultured Caudovirales phage]
MPSQMKVKDLDYHRNGISGQGFYVGIVEEIEGGTKRDMLVVRFVGSDDIGTRGGIVDRDVGGVVCAAFDLAMLDKGIIAFGFNSFRGDHYSGVMDEAIAKMQHKTMSARMKDSDKRSERARKALGLK